MYTPLTPERILFVSPSEIVTAVNNHSHPRSPYHPCRFLTGLLVTKLGLRSRAWVLKQQNSKIIWSRSGILLKPEFPETLRTAQPDFTDVQIPKIIRLKMPVQQAQYRRPPMLADEIDGSLLGFGVSDHEKTP